MLGTGKVDYDDLKFAVARAKRLDGNLRRKMQTQLRSDLGSIAQKTAQGVPSSTLRGFGARWGNAVGKVKTATGGKVNKAIVMIVVSGPSFEKNLAIAERAGSRSSGFTPSGRAMISNSTRQGGLEERNPLVKGVGGRFIFAEFLKHQDEIRQKSLDIIGAFIDDVNSKSWGR